MSAPAVPTAQTASAPTTEVGSTESAPYGQAISAIGIGGAPTQEAPTHAGNVNLIDPYFKEQFIPLDSFVWSTHQQPGTLLWSTKIAPQYSHSHIQYLARMYNVWAGGFDFNIKVAGTGFHAGALMCVRLPPNISPTDVTSISQIGVFEYLIIDPKTLEVVSEHLMDQRRQMYHYTSISDDKDDIGGHFAIYVMIQLNTSSTGTSQIMVQTLTRAAQDFQFAQIRPLNLTSPPINEFFELFSFLNDWQEVVPWGLTPATKMEVWPSLEAEPPIYSYGCFDFEGRHLYNATTQGIPAYGNMMFRALKTGSFAILDTPMPMPSPQVEETFVQTLISVAGNFPKMIGVNFFSGVYKQLYLHEPIDVKKGDLITLAPLWPITLLTKNQIPPRLGEAESYLSFGTDSFNCLQTLRMAEVIKSVKIPLKPDEAILFTMIDKTLNLPVRRLKLYYSGIITTGASPNHIIYSAEKYKWQFEQIVRAAEPIPGEASFAVNDLLSRHLA